MRISQEDFDLFVKRLKDCLKIKSDKQLAELLDMPTSTYNNRKKALDFPDIELNALANKRPELPIDFDYIYTGSPATAFERNDRQAGIAAFATDFLEPRELSEEEKHLVRLFRILSGEGKDALLTCAEGMAYKKEHSPFTGILQEVRQNHEQLEKALKSQAKSKMNIENSGQVINTESVHTISNVMEIKYEKKNRN